MKIKSIALLGVGAFGGFIGGALFVTDKMLSSKHVQEAVRNEIYDVVKAKLDDFIFGEENVRSRKPNRVSYRFCEASFPSFHIDHVFFGSFADAEAVLDAMKDIIAKYGMVSVSDFYDLAHIPSDDNHIINRYGWTNINGAEVVYSKRCGNYTLRLPLPEKV